MKVMEVDMRSVLLLSLTAAGCVGGLAAIALPTLTKIDARQEVLAVARQRLSHSANQNGSGAVLRLDHADKTSFYFNAYATRPCLPGQAICSSLIGHFRVDRQSRAVFDEDVEPERRVS